MILKLNKKICDRNYNSILEKDDVVLDSDLNMTYYNFLFIKYIICKLIIL